MSLQSVLHVQLLLPALRHTELYITILLQLSIFQLSCWWGCRRSQWITKVLRIHPLGTTNGTLFTSFFLKSLKAVDQQMDIAILRAMLLARLKIQ